MTVTPLQRPARKATRTWTEFLDEHIDPVWRCGEWDPTTWTFTGDPDQPQTVLWHCPGPGCPRYTRTENAPCAACRRVAKDLGCDWRDIPPRNAIRKFYGPDVPLCAVPGCERDKSMSQFCHRHGSALKKRRRDGHSTTDEEFIARAKPHKRLPHCVVVRCEREEFTNSLCRLHDARYKRSGLPLNEWLISAQPPLHAHQFCLETVPDPIRRELLAYMQFRDVERGNRMDPIDYRKVVVDICAAGVTTFMDWDVEQYITGEYNDKVRRSVPAILRGAMTYTALLHQEWSGSDPTEGDLWMPHLVGLTAHMTNEKATSLTPALDFRPIRQEWLREVTKSYIRSLRPVVTRCRELVRSATLASQALSATRSGGDPSRLGVAEMTGVVEAIDDMRLDNGELFSAPVREDALNAWWTLIDYGRRARLMDDVPLDFARHELHVITDAPVEVEDDDIGKSLPTPVLRSLNANLDLFDSHFERGINAWSPEDMGLLYKTVVILLRDTGRRPNEIASLARDPLVFQDGVWHLKYDNRKAKRRGRILPIFESTAQAVRDWQAVLDRQPFIPDDFEYLFPSPRWRGAQKRSHVMPATVSNIVRDWVERIPDIPSEVIGDDGEPEAFPRERIYPYAFRHTYAQMHADNGTPPDVLRDLMDHKSFQTTLTYYRIRLARKADAVQKVGPLAVDRFGHSARVCQEFCVSGSA